MHHRSLRAQVGVDACADDAPEIKIEPVHFVPQFMVTHEATDVVEDTTWPSDVEGLGIHKNSAQTDADTYRGRERFHWAEESRRQHSLVVFVLVSVFLLFHLGERMLARGRQLWWGGGGGEEQG